MKLFSSRSVSRFGSSLLVLIVLVSAMLAPAMLVNAQPANGDEASYSISLVADEFNQPIYVTGASDGTARLFVVEKAGRIMIVEDGVVRPEPFLDLTDKVDTSGLERSMLGLVFHPDYATNGRLFVTYVPVEGMWRLEEYVVSNDPRRVDSTSARELLFLSDDQHYGGHFGGMMAFGPDGYFYVSIGDGGGEYDPFSHAQNLSTLPGSLLRIDVDSSALPYAIPDDNPFIDMPGVRPEIWLYGLRNPWRFSFDSQTGDLYIGDVGHVDFEEVNYVPAGDRTTRNFGWPQTEGLGCSVAHPDCNPDLYDPPLHVYPHANTGCSITGGYVYRAHPASQRFGQYMFGDYCEGTIWALNENEEGALTREVVVETDLNISSFGIDDRGQLYVTDVSGGGLYRLVDGSLAGAATIDRLSQSAIVSGGAACMLDIFGSNFDSDAAILWNDELFPSAAVHWIDSGQIRMKISSGADALQPVNQLEVLNPATGTTPSNTVTLEILSGLITDNAIDRIWGRTDLPVLAGEAERTWLWGPGGVMCPALEPYTDSPAGLRAVQYFDKGRLEVTQPDSDAGATWYVTSGLLATEMITGRVQLGDNEFDNRAPASISVAGDFGSSEGPTYATLSQRRDDPATPEGATIDSFIDAAGVVSVNPAFASYEIQVAAVDEVTNHGIAEPFWDFQRANGIIWDANEYGEGELFLNPLYASGRPITEAYWTTLPVGGELQDVLLQCFERRCLTYTPGNPEGWQIEAGNTGMHYLAWRYER